MSNSVVYKSANASEAFDIQQVSAASSSMLGQMMSTPQQCHVGYETCYAIKTL